MNKQGKIKLLECLGFGWGWDEDEGRFFKKENYIMPRVTLNRVEKVLTSLAEIEQIVIQKRFDEDLTLKRTGEIIGRSVERVRQIEAKALRKLKHPSRIKFLHGITSVRQYNRYLEKYNSTRRNRDTLKKPILGKVEETV